MSGRQAPGTPVYNVRVRRSLSNLIVLVMSFVLLAIALLSAWCGATGNYPHLGFGRGYRTFDIGTGPHGLSLELTRYATPLTSEHPDARFFRTYGYGWFVGNVRQSGITAGGLAMIKEEVDYAQPGCGVFMTVWGLCLPYWLALLAAAPAPAFWVWRRVRKGRAACAERAFPVLRSFRLATEGSQMHTDGKDGT
jgi:hypothetical protein